MNIALNTKIVDLRKEKTRVLMYKTGEYDHMIEKYGFIHPTVAIFLALLNNKRNLEATINELFYVSGLPTIEKTENFVTNVMNGLKQFFGDDVFIDLDKEPVTKIKTYNPMDFIIENQKVNLNGQRLDTPLDINFIITQKCNRSCIYCYAEKEQAPKFDLLSLSRIKEIIDEAQSIGVYDITFSGGEPFLRKDFIEILDYTIKSGIHPFVSTKQYLSLDKCKRLKEIGLETIQVSIDSDQEEVANFLVGSPIFFRQIIKTIKNLKEAGLTVKTKAVVTPFNIFSIINLITLVAKLGVDRMQITQYGKSAFRHRENLFLEEPEVRWLKNEIELFKKNNASIYVYDNLSSYKPITNIEEKQKRWDDRAVCSVGKVALTILPDGRILACEQLPTSEEFIVGDLKTQSIMEVWNSERLWNIVVPPRELFEGELCYNCNLFFECHAEKGRCIRDAVNAYGKAYTADPRCPFNPNEVRLM